MTKILDAKSVIESKLPLLVKECTQLTEKGKTPHLAVILVGANPASVSYVKNKEKMCQKIGANFELIKLDETISKEEFLAEVDRINTDPKVTGCFVQLPVPSQLKDIKITQLINPLKDVDGFHLDSVNKLYLGELDGLISCTPKGIVTLLIENKIEIEGKDIVIIGRSAIVGKPLSLLLQIYNATTTLCHSKTKNLKKHTKNADIIISAVGSAQFLDSSYLNTNKDQIVIDVGMNSLNGKLVGDVKYDEIKENVKAITPVPGGVGPMTVFSLMENLIKSTSHILELERKDS